ncbi:MAG: BBP7 family outer membrane beta-barrel protein [Gemmataceae bacterium]
MKARMASFVLGGVLSLGASVGASPPAVPAAAPTTILPGSTSCCPPPITACPPVSACPSVAALPACDQGLGLRFEADAEFLLWWLRPDGLPPLAVATIFPEFGGPPGVTRRTVLGDSHIGDNPNPGGRFAGRVFTEQGIGFGVSGFFLDQSSQSTSLPAYPPLSAPIFNAATGQPIDWPLVGGFNNGGVALDYSTTFWGLEGNAYFRAIDESDFRLDFFGGFRFLQLTEGLTFSRQIFNQRLLFSLNGYDTFDTQNDFYGGQLGARAQFAYQHFVFSATGQVALGSTCSSVDIRGSNTFELAGFDRETTPGSVFSQDSNIGHHTRSQLSIIPQINLAVGYRCFDWCTVSVGYDFLYWNRIVRPGEQIDRSFTFAQAGNAAAIGAARPAATLDATDFWAQGLTFSLLFAF